MKRLARVFAVLAIFGVLAFAQNFAVDKSHSRVGFTVTHMMISEVDGNFKDFSATIDFDPKKMVFTKLDASIVADSINTENQKRDDHLRSSDFFDAKKYPNLTFVMTKYEPKSQKKGIMHGKLTIRGITKNVALETKIKGMITDPWGNERLGFELEGTVNRKDFGLNWNKTMDKGGVLVGDEVDLSIKIEAKEEEAK